MSVTIKDIARIAGVSHATVSRSLNDSPLVAEDTRAKIKELAETLDFEFNAGARSLSTNRSGTICVVFPEGFGEYGISIYYNMLLNEVKLALEEEEIDIIVSYPINEKTKESNIKRLITSRKIDGLFIIHPKLNEVDKGIINFMEISKIPFIFLHHYPELCEPNTVDSIYADHFDGGYNATDYLIKLNHNKIACVTSVGDSLEFRKRTEGYKAALSYNGIPFDEELVFHGYRDISSGYNIIKEKIRVLLKKGVTAIFAQTDLMAIGVIEALKELSIRIPEDISVMGYDDIDLLSEFKPLLTTVHQPREEIAAFACERLIEKINGKKRKNKLDIVLRSRIVVRETTKQNI